MSKLEDAKFCAIFLAPNIAFANKSFASLFVFLKYRYTAHDNNKEIIYYARLVLQVSLYVLYLLRFMKC